MTARPTRCPYKIPFWQTIKPVYLLPYSVLSSALILILVLFPGLFAIPLFGQVSQEEADEIIQEFHESIMPVLASQRFGKFVGLFEAYTDLNLSTRSKFYTEYEYGTYYTATMLFKRSEWLLGAITHTDVLGFSSTGNKAEARDRLASLFDAVRVTTLRSHNEAVYLWDSNIFNNLNAKDTSGMLAEPEFLELIAGIVGYKATGSILWRVLMTLVAGALSRALPSPMGYHLMLCVRDRRVKWLF
ncbi:hypothetical protein FACS1894208_00320 [Clostridia bacterium]|nr:hypothetical protein FACS1894208_00320 [Clostridia bacterium]